MQKHDQGFPRIQHIDDVLPWIENKPEFSVREAGDFTVIDYNYQQPNTFIDPVARECRGIKFHPDGRIMSRPPHKFFNKGERRDLEFDWAEEAEPEAWMKLDGSLIFPVIVNGETTLGTKAGPTVVSRMCMMEIDPSVNFMTVIDRLFHSGYTPAFEYTSPSNRIVVRYNEPRLTLIAVRETMSGNYLSFDDPVVKELRKFVPIPEQIFDPVSVVQRDWQENEGVVLAWPNGFRLKVKADEYVMRHRVKSYLDSEKTVLEFILDEKHDDLAGILFEDDFARLDRHAGLICSNIHNVADQLLDEVSEASRMETRKDQAMFLKDRLDSILLKPAFSILDGKEPMDAVADLARSKIGSATKIEELRKLIFTPAWEG